MRALALFVVALAGCSDPSLTAAVRVGEDGLTVRPLASAGVGGLTVTVAP